MRAWTRGARFAIKKRPVVGRLIAWLLFDGWHGLPGGVGENLCSIFPSAAQRGYTGLERLVYNGKADELLAEGGNIAQAEEHRIVIAVELEIASEIGA